jgi:hypothetical protein
MKTTVAKQLLKAIAAAVALCWSAESQAAFVFGYGNITVNQGGNFALGNNFSVSSTVNVTQLGVFTQDLATGSPIPIAIYEHTGGDPTSGWNLVPNTSFNVGLGDPVDALNQTTYLNIPSVKLTPGLYSVVTVTTSDYNSGFGYPSPSLVTFNNPGGLADGTYDIWNYAGSLTPTLSGLQTTGPGTGYPWLLPVFGAGTLSVTPIPESTTLISGALLLLPFGARTLRILRRRRVG